MKVVSGGYNVTLNGTEHWGELTYGTNPLNNDTDGDGLSDGDEVITHHTNPLSNDTDMDGLTDYEELKRDITYTANYYDVNGVYHGEEMTIPAGNLSPLNPDSDGDSLTDGQEINGWKVMVAWQEEGEEDADILVNAAETIIEHIDDAVATPLN